MSVKSLYKDGLLFLNAASTYAPEGIVNRAIINTFFQGKENKTIKNTLMYYQKFGNINTILKLIVDVVVESALRLEKPIPIEVDVLNFSRILLPIHVYTNLESDGWNANIGISKIVIPIHSKMDIANVSSVLKTMRNNLKNNLPTEKIYKDFCKGMDVFFSFPVSDQLTPFIYIDSNNVVDGQENTIGCFTTSNNYRVTIIGTNIYTESVNGGTYIKRVIDTTQPTAREQILEVFSEDKLMGDVPTLINAFIESKGKVIQV